MQPKKPRFNPLVIAIVLAAVLMVWSVLGGTGGSASGSSMAYSTVVHYFESNQVTKFSLDLNTGVITKKDIYTMEYSLVIKKKITHTHTHKHT